MSEGGLLAWKIQKVKRPANGVQSTCNFSDLNHPLPEPPKGQTWMKDGRDWKLVPVAEARAILPEEGAEFDMVAANSVEVGDLGRNEAEAVVVSAVPIIPTEATELTAGESSTATTCAGVIKADDMIQHKVLPTDTFQGICLRYKITPVELRRANKMMGTNLKLAPETLLIPVNGKNESLHSNNEKREMTREEKIAKLVWEVSNSPHPRSDKTQQPERTLYLEYSEARAYLELNEWDLNRAVENAVEDLGWSLKHV
jgi:hypothetical protein